MFTEFKKSQFNDELLLLLAPTPIPIPVPIVLPEVEIGAAEGKAEGGGCIVGKPEVEEAVLDLLSKKSAKEEVVAVLAVDAGLG